MPISDPRTLILLKPYEAMVRSPSRLNSFRGTIALVCIVSFVSLLPFALTKPLGRSQKNGSCGHEVKRMAPVGTKSKEEWRRSSRWNTKAPAAQRQRTTREPSRGRSTMSAKTARKTCGSRAPPSVPSPLARNSGLTKRMCGTRDTPETVIVGTPSVSRTSLVTSEPHLPLLPKSTPVQNSLRPAHTARRFFGGESELDRLQRENAELKKKLGETQNGQGGGIIEKIGNGIKSLFGGEKKDSAPLSQPSFPTLGLLGSFLQPAIRMMGSLLKDSQDDIQTVLAEAESILTRSGRLGSGVTCGPIFSQSYSSMNINGQQSTRVQLQFQAKGDQRSGTASCSASIGPDGVNFQNLSLDGQPIDTSGPSASAGNVIDVER